MADQESFGEPLGHGTVACVTAQRDQRVEDLGAPLRVEEAACGDELEPRVTVAVLELGPREHAGAAPLPHRQGPQAASRTVHTPRAATAAAPAATTPDAT